MCTSSSARTPKLQLTAQQPLTGECWIPPKKDMPRPRAKKKPQQDGRRGKPYLESNPIPTRDLGELKQTLCSPGPRDPTETEPELCLSVSCKGTGQQGAVPWAGALGGVDLDMVEVLLEEVTINTPHPPPTPRNRATRTYKGLGKQTLGGHK